MVPMECHGIHMEFFSSQECHVCTFLLTCRKCFKERGTCTPHPPDFTCYSRGDWDSGVKQMKSHLHPQKLKINFPYHCMCVVCHSKGCVLIPTVSNIFYWVFLQFLCICASISVSLPTRFFPSWSPVSHAIEISMLISQTEQKLKQLV